jgi:hypothetical protein
MAAAAVAKGSGTISRRRNGSNGIEVEGCNKQLLIVAKNNIYTGAMTTWVKLWTVMKCEGVQIQRQGKIRRDYSSSWAVV